MVKVSKNNKAQNQEHTPRRPRTVPTAKRKVPTEDNKDQDKKLQMSLKSVALDIVVEPCPRQPVDLPPNHDKKLQLSVKLEIEGTSWRARGPIAHWIGRTTKSFDATQDVPWSPTTGAHAPPTIQVRFDPSARTSARPSARTSA